MIIDKDELHDYVREHLAPHKTPRHWFVVEAMPLTGSGKIQKFKLREQWSKGETKEVWYRRRLFARKSTSADFQLLSWHEVALKPSCRPCRPLAGKCPQLP